MYVQSLFGGSPGVHFLLSPETCRPEAADGQASGGSIPRCSNRSGVQATEEAVRLALRGVPWNRRCRGTAVIALRAALFVQDCASCGGYGRKCASCRGLRSLFAFVRAVRAHETQIRPKPVARSANPTEWRARSANPAETRRTKRRSGRSTDAHGVQGREIVGKAVEAAVERVDHTALQARSRCSSRRPAPPCATRGARSVASARQRPRMVLSAAFTSARDGLPSD